MERKLPVAPGPAVAEGSRFVAVSGMEAKPSDLLTAAPPYGHVLCSGKWKDSALVRALRGESLFQPPDDVTRRNLTTSEPVTATRIRRFNVVMHAQNDFSVGGADLMWHRFS